MSTTPEPDFLSFLGAFAVACVVSILLFSLHSAQPLQNCQDTIQAFQGRAAMSALLALTSGLLMLWRPERRGFWGALSVLLIGAGALLHFATPFFC
ncbi:hypothetical protein [Deinococcus marmoris]|uniref:hypothetical protein n=1 Tax=Deinococcus marmoris TaxID=249408 RepID=UPI000495A4B5|nr:hypothetical protein [Deinococcus marmoris]